MMKTKLLVKVAFACMACDGRVEESEIACIQSVFADVINDNQMDINRLLNEYVNELKNNSQLFFNSLFNEIDSLNLSEGEELQLLYVAIKIIEADNIVDYNEIKLLKKIRQHLKVSDEIILSKMPDKEDFIASDVKEDDFSESYLECFDFKNIEIACCIPKIKQQSH